MRFRVGVAVPSIPPRAPMLMRCLASVAVQQAPPHAVSVAIDLDHNGAAATRNRAWRALDTAWVAFVDDDDELLPHHLQALQVMAWETDADLVYPWFEVIGGTDPFPTHFGQDWDPAEPRQTTITCLWRRTALEKIDGFAEVPDLYDETGNRIGEDFDAVKRLNALGGKIVHLPERTWRWHHHGSNTSGRPERW